MIGTTADHERWMQRCLALAELGADQVAPNPMVGAVLVHEGRVLAEGWHKVHGGPHAEVECLKAWDGPIPKGAVLYVNLEPCAHHGKTPPCADLLIQRGVEHVVVGLVDPFDAVAGKGIARLEAAGTHVQVGVLADRCRWSQRRFLKAVESGRPYTVLKWARSTDGFLDRHPRERRGVDRISSSATDVLVHRWRSEEQAILVGSRTVLNDDPSLTVRHIEGRQPLRIVLDRAGICPRESAVFRGSGSTLLFTAHTRPDIDVEQVTMAANEDPIDRIHNELHARSIRSLLVEGGAELHGHFLDSGRWDEARVITGTKEFMNGTVAPHPGSAPASSFTLSGDRIDLHINHDTAVLRGIRYDPTWPW